MLILVQILFLWVDGGLHAQELLPIVIFNGLATPFLLALIQLFDNQAMTALNSMRSSLEITEHEFDEFHYKLSNMPSLAALIAGLTLLAAVIVMEQVSAVPSRYAALGPLPIFTAVFHIIDKSSAFMYGVIIYHTRGFPSGFPGLIELEQYDGVLPRLLYHAYTRSLNCAKYADNIGGIVGSCHADLSPGRCAAHL